jgi:diadenosine tetraphosphate (Ap4A) HIT family hydrolase
MTLVPDKSMNTNTFELHYRLRDDTFSVCELPLCSVLLMNDARYPWVILVPRIADVREIWELSAADQATLWSEVTRTAEQLKSLTRADKMNIASIGNLVPQLHVHVIARKVGDAVWPAPVWGRGEAQPYGTLAAVRQVEALRLGLPARRT